MGHQQQPNPGMDDDIIEGEIVAEFADETFLNLPPVPGKDQVKSAELPPDTGRRDFVLRLLVGGTAALALGGSAALWYSKRQSDPETQELILPYGSQVGDAATPSNVAELVQRVADLEYQVAALTAERDQSQSELHSANTDVQSLRAQLDAALAELEDARSLNGLWQALDDVGLDDLLQTALDTVGAALTTIVTLVATFQSGVTAGQTALQKFIAAIPGPADGIRWLQQRVTALASDLDWLAQQVQQAVQPVEPFANLIANFVLWVLDRLPFGAGDRARAGLEAMQTVINSLPATVDGINADVLDPLAEWFGDDLTASLTGTLVNPIQQRVLTPARNVVTKVNEFKQTYDEDLAGPSEAALAERAALRAQIDSAQARLGLRS